MQKRLIETVVFESLEPMNPSGLGYGLKGNTLCWFDFDVFTKTAVEF